MLSNKVLFTDSDKHSSYLLRSSSFSDSQARSSRREVIEDPISYDVIYSRSSAHTSPRRRATFACRSLLIANRFIGPGILLEFNTILRCSTPNHRQSFRRIVRFLSGLPFRLLLATVLLLFTSLKSLNNTRDNPQISYTLNHQVRVV